MVPPIGFNGSMPPRMNPDAYAQQYANQKGITVQEAKIELQTKYGDPKPQESQGGNSIFGESKLQGYDSTSFSNSLDSDEMTQGKSLVQIFLDMLKGGNGPRNEGDPQPHLQGASGPQNEGDPQPHLQGAGGPQNEGDPQPHLKKNPFEN